MTIQICDPQPIETCPKEQDVPYVLLHAYGAPVVAQWSDKGYAAPCWQQWLSGEYYGLPLKEDDVIGWYPIRTKQE